MVQIPVTVGVSNGNYVEIREGIASGETVYKIAEKEEEATGLAALFSGLFTNQRVNRNNSWNRNRNGQSGDDAPDFSSIPDMNNTPGGNYPGGGNGSRGQ